MMLKRVQWFCQGTVAPGLFKIEQAEKNTEMVFVALCRLNQDVPGDMKFRHQTVQLVPEIAEWLC